MSKHTIVPINIQYIVPVLAHTDAHIDATDLL